MRAADRDCAAGTGTDGTNTKPTDNQQPSTQPTMVDAPGKVRPAPREPNVIWYRDRPKGEGAQ